MKIFIKKTRLSYPHLFEAQAYEGSEPRFSANYLLEPTHPAVKELTAAIETVAKDKWGAKADAVLKSIRSADKTFLRSGDAKGTDGYEGLLFVSASSKRRPSVVDQDGATPLAEADGKPYGGCFVNAFVEVWAMDNKFGKRVCASLGSVQFHSHGEPFGAGGGAPDSFDAVEDAEEDLV